MPERGQITLSIPVTITRESARFPVHDLFLWRHEGHAGATLALETGDVAIEYRGHVFTLRSEDFRTQLLALLDQADAAARQLEAARRALPSVELGSSGGP